MHGYPMRFCCDHPSTTAPHSAFALITVVDLPVIVQVGLAVDRSVFHLPMPVPLASSRDEDACFHFATMGTATATIMATRRGKPRGSHSAVPRRRVVLGHSARHGTPNYDNNAATTSTKQPPPSLGTGKFLVCAGQGVTHHHSPAFNHTTAAPSSSSLASSPMGVMMIPGTEDRTSYHTSNTLSDSHRPSINNGGLRSDTTPVFATTPREPQDTSQPLSSGSSLRLLTPRTLQRSDSELERIISALREKITVQHREDAKRMTEPLSQGDPEDAGVSSSPCMSRKHLKNPLERMHLANSASGLLRRQPSASHVGRVLSESSATILSASAVTGATSRSALTTGVGGSPATATTGLNGGTSAALAESEAAGFRIRSFATVPDAGSKSTQRLHPHFVSSTMLGVRPTLGTSHGAHGTPSAGSGSAAATSNTNTNANDTGSEAWHLGMPRATRKDRLTARASAASTNGLWLNLDRVRPEFDDEGNDEDVSGSQSPVGPWIVDDDPSTDSASVSARDPGDGESLSSARSNTSLASSHSSAASSTGSLLASGGGGGGLGDHSPRSRLLWLSNCSLATADEVCVQAWGASRRMMELLRPGAQWSARRPRSAMTRSSRGIATDGVDGAHRRVASRPRPKSSSATATTAKSTRGAASGQGSRRNGSHNDSNNNQNSNNNNQNETMAPRGLLLHPSRGGSSGSTGTRGSGKQRPKAGGHPAAGSSRRNQSRR